MIFQSKASPTLLLVGVKKIARPFSEDVRRIDPRLEQLRDLANDPNPNVSEVAWSDLYKEFGVWKGAEDNHEEDLHPE